MEQSQNQHDYQQLTDDAIDAIKDALIDVSTMFSEMSERIDVLETARGVDELAIAALDVSVGQLASDNVEINQHLAQIDASLYDLALGGGCDCAELDELKRQLELLRECGEEVHQMI